MRIISPDRRRDEELDSRTRWERIRRGIILVLLGISMVFYREQLWEIIVGIRQVSPFRLCIGILLALTAYAVEGMAIRFMMDTTIPCAIRRGGIKIALLCEFYRMITLGSGSGIAEIHYMHANGIEPGNATALTMIRYMFKRVAVMAMGVLGFGILYCRKATGPFCREYGVFMGVASLISLAVIMCFLCLALSARIVGWVLRLLDWLNAKWPSWEKRVSGWKEQVLLLNQSGRKVLIQSRKMIGVALCQFGKLLLFYSIPICFLKGYTGLTATEGVLLMAVAYMLSGVIPTPSGAGSLEVIFMLAFSEFTGLDMALSAILLFRFATWIMPFAVGGVLLLAERGPGRSLDR